MKTFFHLAILFFLLSACSGPVGMPAQAPTYTPAAARAAANSPVPLPPVAIGHRPVPAAWSNGVKTSLPAYDPNNSEPFQVDLRSADASGLDLRQSLDVLNFASFDTQTKWPAADKLPAGFDPRKIIELGKDPGLGIQSIHNLGVTGQGVGIAIIDQALLVDHTEYAARLRLYEEAHYRAANYNEASMHGAALASIAVGKTVGVAPAADLYYIADTTFYDFNTKEYDFTYLARSVRRVLEINRGLPEGRKIRVLAIAVGWSKGQKGYDEITQAASEARAAGLLVISSSVAETHGFRFHGLGRDPLADPDRFDSYVPGLFWAKDFFGGQRFNDRLLVPMDSRTTAGPHGPDDYAFYRSGGWSWSIPYIAGMYALAAQVKPSVTPDEFWGLAMRTGRTIQLSYQGESIPFGPILDPPALLRSLVVKSEPQ